MGKRLSQSWLIVFLIALTPATSVGNATFTFDIDADGSTAPLTDGLLILRHLFGFTGEALSQGALSSVATRTDPDALTSHLDQHLTSLDVDQSGNVKPLTDGLLILRYLFGFTGAALTQGAVDTSGERISNTAITAYLSSLTTEAGSDISPVGGDPNLGDPNLGDANESALHWQVSRATPASVGLDASQVDRVLTHIFTDAAVQSATLAKAGYIIGERFAENTNAQTMGTSWSVAKSFYSAAVGVAIDQGLINATVQPASDFLVEWQGTDKANITIGHLLEMRSGIADTLDLYYSEDHTAFSLAWRKSFEEGTRFVYSNPTSQLFEPLLYRATGLNAHDFLAETILRPIGIDPSQVGMWFDPSGLNPLTYMGLDMRAEDMIRFGILYARGGRWEDQQVISKDYVSRSLSAQSAYYGYQWWVLNDAYFGQPVRHVRYAALGLDGQKIYVWPEADLVLVVLTQYTHSPSQGYTLSTFNFPNTCAARRSCPGLGGSVVPSYDEHALMEMLDDF